MPDNTADITTGIKTAAQESSQAKAMIPVEWALLGLIQSLRDMASTKVLSPETIAPITIAIREFFASRPRGIPAGPELDFTHAALRSTDKCLRILRRKHKQYELLDAFENVINLLDDCLCGYKERKKDGPCLGVLGELAMGHVRQIADDTGLYLNWWGDRNQDFKPANYWRDTIADFHVEHGGLKSGSKPGRRGGRGVKSRLKDRLYRAVVRGSAALTDAGSIAILPVPEEGTV